MSKESDTQITENTEGSVETQTEGAMQILENAAEETSTTKTRERRVKSNAVLPSAENSWSGSVSIEILKGATHTFSYTVPENTSVFLVRAIDAGIKARFASVCAGISDPVELDTALVAELVELNAGNFAKRVTTSQKVEFNNSVVALAMLTVVDKLSQLTFEVVKNTLDNLDALTAAKASWDGTEDKKSFESKMFRACKSIVSTYRVMMESEEEVETQIEGASA